jgi:hypothetical protein
MIYPQKLFSIVSLLYLASFSHTYGQVSMGVSFGYGNFNMKEMKDRQSEDAEKIRDSLSIKPSSVYNYPSYWSIGGQITFNRNKNTFAFTGRTTATAGRLDYQDFSGIIRADRKLSTFAIGGEFDRTFWQGHSFARKDSYLLKAGMGIEYYITRTSIDDRIEIFSALNPYHRSVHYSSGQVTLNPMLSMYYGFEGRPYIELSAGYRIQALTSKMPSNAAVAAPDWSGLFVRFTTGIKLGKIE